MLESDRLILRPWTEDDAKDLYEYASDPLVGPRAGWRPHPNPEHSLQIIRTVFSAPETYALELKTLHRPIGCISLVFFGNSPVVISEDEAELGYWLGRPFWGRGLMPEAVEAMLRHAFHTLRLNTVWCGYFDGNLQSWRVQQKAGFVRRYKAQYRLNHGTGKRCTVYYTSLTKKDFEKRRST